MTYLLSYPISLFMAVRFLVGPWNLVFEFWEELFVKIDIWPFKVLKMYIILE